MQKISIVISSMNGGGAEKVTANLVNGFVNKGYHIDLVLVKKEGVFLGLIPPEVKIVDLASRRIVAAVFPLIKYLKSNNPDAIISIDSDLNVITAVAWRLANCTAPLVWTVHVNLSRAWSLLPFYKRLILKSLTIITCGIPKAIIAVSNGVASDFQKYIGKSQEKVLTIYNPVVSSVALQPKEKFQGNHNPLQLLAVGRLFPQKNYPLLLNALKIASQSRHVILTILGEGPHLPEIEKLIEELQLSKIVNMHGFSATPLKFMEQADALILSSNFEGLPTVLIEAMSMGTPVISTDCPSGPREILQDGRWGRLVPQNDEKALSQAIIDLYDNGGIDGRARAEDFLISNSTEKYSKVIFE